MKANIKTIKNISEAMVKEAAKKIVNGSKASNGSCIYKATAKIWEKDEKKRMYIKIVETTDGTKHYATKNCGYFDMKNGVYVVDNNNEINLFGEYDFNGRKLPVAEPETEENEAAETVETANTNDEMKNEIVKTMEAAAKMDAEMYREKGMSEDRVQTYEAAMNNIVNIIKSTNANVVRAYFADLEFGDDTRKNAQKIYAQIKMNVPNGEAQKDMKDKILTEMKSAR